jgi:sugar lactone lactonase YvrE
MVRFGFPVAALVGLTLMLPGAVARAEGLPPLFVGVPRRTLPARTVATFPVKTFLENIAVADDGALFVTSLEDGVIYRVTPAGKKAVFARIPGKVAGIAFAPGGGSLLVTGWAGGNTPTVFRVTRGGKVSPVTAVKGAVFLNGITRLSGDTYLIADSYRGAIWRFDARTGRYAVWLEDSALARSDPKHPFPGVNGLKVVKGALYATNTDRQQLLRIPLTPDGKAAGKPEVVAENLNGDDFAADGDGSLYITTHVYDSVVRVAPGGGLSVVAEAPAGVVGCTSLAFGRGPKDRRALFVVTNGGMSYPPAGGVQPARIVRLDLSAAMPRVRAGTAAAPRR